MSVAAHRTNHQDRTRRPVVHAAGAVGAGGRTCGPEATVIRLRSVLRRARIGQRSMVSDYSGVTPIGSRVVRVRTDFTG